MKKKLSCTFSTPLSFNLVTRFLAVQIEALFNRRQYGRDDAVDDEALR
jgi:hypothetical protein